MMTEAVPVKKPFYKRKGFLYGVAIFFAVGFIGSLFDKTPVPVPATQQVVKETATKPTFSDMARARFDDIQKSIPELNTISCVDNVCDSVAYFDFKSVPTDMETIIRGNAATFSKFKLDNTGVSHVSVIARVDGNDVFTCRAVTGKVTDCK